MIVLKFDMDRKELVRCPNHCFNGWIKTYEEIRAFFGLTKCPYCKGEGTVTKEQSKIIIKLL